MATFHLAVHTLPGTAARHDVLVGVDGRPPAQLTAPTRIALACGCADPAGFSVRAQPVLRSQSTPAAALHALPPEACLALFIDPADLSLFVQARPAVPQHAAPLEFFRLADATVKLLPPHPAPLHFLAGDTYLALTPGALALADSPAIARFIHLRDYFNAEKMAAALLDYLLDIQPATPPEDITALVLELR